MLIYVIREFIGLRLLLAGLRALPDDRLRREIAEAVVKAVAAEIAR